jgi:hypothetical protein
MVDPVTSLADLFLRSSVRQCATRRNESQPLLVQGLASLCLWTIKTQLAEA